MEQGLSPFLPFNTFYASVFINVCVKTVLSTSTKHRLPSVPYVDKTYSTLLLIFSNRIFLSPYSNASSRVVSALQQAECRKSLILSLRFPFTQISHRFLQV